MGRFGKFAACSNSPACDWKASVSATGEIVEKKAAIKTEHKCPDCKDGHFLIREYKTKAGEAKSFYACDGYPKCKGSASIGEGGSPVSGAKKSSKSAATKDTGKKCPKCKKGSLRQIEGKSGTFIGCSEFKSGCKYTAKV